MGQKVHPTGFRLGYTKTWSSRWFAEGPEYGKLLLEDTELRRDLKDRLGHAGIAEIEIERAANKLKVTIHASRPGIVIGRKGSEVEKLRDDIQKRTGGFTEFVPLAAILDDEVGNEIEIELERGGRNITESVVVTDLHSITPSEFLEFGDAIVNNLSYQQSRHYNRSPEGVYVANPGYILSKAAIPRGAVITEVGGVPVGNIDDFEKALDTLSDGERKQVFDFSIGSFF